MAQWQKIKITRVSGEEVDAQAPIIISASRSTDIPAFYADWFFHRLKIGYSAWTNPFNGVKSYVSYKNARFFVFWSKNPKPLLEHIDELKKMNFYIQFTLNDYVSEGLEKGVPPLEERIETFKQLVKIFGKGRVIWRFDPLILTDKITVDDLLRKVENIGDQLFGYTEKLVFSFADIALYKKVKSNLEKNNINYYEWTESQMFDFAKSLSELNKKWNFQLATCGEKIDISQFGIQHNKCIDDDLMIRFANHDKVLMDYLGVEIVNSLFEGEKIIKKKDNRDKGQRQFCGCIVSKDIGEYNTCPHLCDYCYANTSKELARRNYEQAKQTGLTSETITGKIMLIEQTTTYAYKLKYFDNPTFDKVRGFAKKFIDDLPKELVDGLYSQLERGVVMIDSEPQMLVYLYAFGNMHQAKLNKAFENLPELFFEQPEINIIDYGCGQAVGTMCYVDFIRQQGISQKVKRVTLIEPSEICLKRAALHVSKFCPDAEIVTINKEFDELVADDIICEGDIPTLHILSNVLDLKFDLGNFAQVISDNLKGYNQFVCVGPYFGVQLIDSLMDDFAGFFDGEDVYNKIFEKYELNSDKPWTGHIRCFSVEELNNRLSTKVCDDDYQNSIKDEFGFEYSYNGEKLLCCNNYDLDFYEIKKGTRYICEWAFFDSGLDYEDCVNQLSTIIIPNTTIAIGRYAFKLCKFLQGIVIPNSVTYIGDYAFECCESLREIIIPNSVSYIGDGAFYGCESLQHIFLSDSVKYIGAKAFAVCKSLREIIIPHSVTYLKSSVFGGCESLQYITIQNSKICVEKQLFGDIKKTPSIIIPPERLTCESLQKIIVPKESIEKFKRILPFGYWDKLYYLKKAIDDIEIDNDDLPF